MLEEEDIKKVWNNVVIVSIENVMGLINKGGVKPVLLSNGYMASLSIDIINNEIRPLHLSISNPSGLTDAAEGDIIANDILGEGCKYMGIMYNTNCVHFMKIEKDDIINDIISKKKKGEKIR